MGCPGALLVRAEDDTAIAGYRQSKKRMNAPVNRDTAIRRPQRAGASMGHPLRVPRDASADHATSGTEDIHGHSCCVQRGSHLGRIPPQERRRASRL